MEVCSTYSSSFKLVCTNINEACFKIESGDVEDAPALDPIAKFEILEKDGAVYIKGEESTIKANRQTLNIKCSAQGNEKVLVIGGYANLNYQ